MIPYEQNRWWAENCGFREKPQRISKAAVLRELLKMGSLSLYGAQVVRMDDVHQKIRVV